MPKFAFRLQRVLEYREMVEEWAKDAYLEARRARLEAFASLETLELRRGALLAMPAETLADRRALGACFDKLDEEEKQLKIVLETLSHEEEKQKEEWIAARREFQALEKLRDAALAEWQIHENRQEQKELDEWSVTRRAA